MSDFNPITGSILQSTAVQRQQTASKSQQVRRSQQLKRNIAQPDEDAEHQVQSAEELRPIHEQSANEHPTRRPRRRGGAAQTNQPDPEEDLPRLDLTA